MFKRLNAVQSITWKKKSDPPKKKHEARLENCGPEQSYGQVLPGIVKLHGQVVPVFVVGRDDRLDGTALAQRGCRAPRVARVHDAVLAAAQFAAKKRHSCTSFK